MTERCVAKEWNKVPQETYKVRSVFKYDYYYFRFDLDGWKDCRREWQGDGVDYE